MMAGYVLIGMFAAFGIFCSIWALLGLMLPETGGTVICPVSPGLPERDFLLRWLYLAETGLIRGTLAVVDQGLEAQDKKWLSRFESRIEICTPEELILRFGIGAEST